MDKRVKYKIKAIFTLSSWFRNLPTHKRFDDWLWEALVNDDIVFKDEYNAFVAGHEVWVANYPYANGKVRNSFSCSRGTAILLMEKTKEFLKGHKEKEFNEKFTVNSYAHKAKK